MKPPPGQAGEQQSSYYVNILFLILCEFTLPRASSSLHGGGFGGFLDATFAYARSEG